MQKVFVYGTLKSGHGNNRLLREARYIGREAIQIPGHFKSLGGFPGLVRTKDDKVTTTDMLHSRPVGGELWEVDEPTLRRLDMLEGHPRFYERREIETSQGTAWTYTLPPTDGYLQCPEVQHPFWEQTEAEAEWFAKWADSL